MNKSAKMQQLLNRHGIVGPVFCASIVAGSVYGAVLAVRQIKIEWGYIRKNSRQSWKEKLVAQKPS